MNTWKHEWFGTKELLQIPLYNQHRQHGHTAKGCEWHRDSETTLSLCSNQHQKARFIKKNHGFTIKYHLPRGGWDDFRRMPCPLEMASDHIWQLSFSFLGVTHVRDGNATNILLDRPLVESFNFAKDFILKVVLCAA